MIVAKGTSMQTALLGKKDNKHSSAISEDN